MWDVVLDGCAYRPRYVDAERTGLGLQLLNVSVLHPSDDGGAVKGRPDNDGNGIPDLQIVQIVGTDDDIKSREHKRDRLLSAKQSYLRAIPDHSDEAVEV